MSSVMYIEDPTLLDVKQVVSDLMGKPGGRMVRLLLVNQQSVFGFESKNTVQHLSQPQRIEAPSAGGVKDLPA